METAKREGWSARAQAATNDVVAPIQASGFTGMSDVPRPGPIMSAVTDASIPGHEGGSGHRSRLRHDGAVDRTAVFNHGLVSRRHATCGRRDAPRRCWRC